MHVPEGSNLQLEYYEGGVMPWVQLISWIQPLCLALSPLSNRFFIPLNAWPLLSWQWRMVYSSLPMGKLTTAVNIAVFNELSQASVERGF